MNIVDKYILMIGLLMILLGVLMEFYALNVALIITGFVSVLLSLISIYLFELSFGKDKG